MWGVIPSLPICHYGVHRGTYYNAVGLTRQMHFMTVNHGQKVLRISILWKRISLDVCLYTNMQNTLLHKTYHGKYLFTHLAIWRTFLENPETKMKQLGHYSDSKLHRNILTYRNQYANQH
jgi:hypothetical protein